MHDRRDTPPGVSGPYHNQKYQVRFSSSLRGAKRRGNLLERGTNPNVLPGDCHVGLCPPRNDSGNFNLVLLLGPDRFDPVVGTPIPGCPERTIIRRTGFDFPCHCEEAVGRRGNPHPLRCTASPGPGGTGRRTDCHGPLALAMTAVILTWSCCFTQKKNPRFLRTGGFGVLRHRSFQQCSRRRAVYAGFTPL